MYKNNEEIIEIWDRFRSGNNDAFSVLYETFLDILFRYGMKFVLNEDVVKDCIQDLFIKLYNNRTSLAPIANPKLYLLLSLKNMIIDVISRDKRVTYVAPEDLPFIASYQYLIDQDDTEDEEIKEKFEQVIRILNPRQKEAIYLRFQLDLSYDEISRLLGVNYQSARNLIHRSILKIREEMGLTGFMILFLQAFK
ncbi:MAG: sigma-70 family RNA polymerase sigma factor [Tannerella sp.]|jgi:RNA polymerase sigma factor (sigma-70 family)|nr:sigma-70 family RNA polymerase sigma factor [Tannerella sp.]